MKGDFSRIRFTPEKNYTAVLQQQGRVALDADANEQTAIDAYLRDTTNVDLIGSHGAPAKDAGFGIWIENGKIRIGRGRYYVDGILVENDRDRDYSDQKFLIPTAGASDPSSESSLIKALEGGTNVQFVLQVWRRLVTELDDPCLVEPAIGQADTTARLQTVWRVIGTTVDSTNAGDGTENTGSQGSCCCEGLTLEEPPEHTGKMTAQTNPAGDDCGCQPIPAAGYQGLENQLYRVEIHTGGSYSEATFKWSRENASVVAQVTDVSGPTVTVNSLGPDANLGFLVNQWVELSDDATLFGDIPNQSGVLYQISALGPGPLQVTLSGTPNVTQSMNPRMRRWDQPMTSPSTGILVSSGPVTLEYGIEVTFSQDGNFVAGDYWTIPARTANGQIDWACGSKDDPYLPSHYFSIYQAPLAYAWWDNSAQKAVVRDCRVSFNSLAEADLAFHNKHLHGWGIVCGLQVNCGSDRNRVTVKKGYAIDCEGRDVRVCCDVPLDLVAMAKSKSLLNSDGDGTVSLVLNSAGTFAVEKQDLSQESLGSFFQNTFWVDFWKGCVQPLIAFVTSEFSTKSGSTNLPVGPGQQRIDTFTNLTNQLYNPVSGQHLFISPEEDTILRNFYAGFKKVLTSRTFCGLFDKARPFPDYPFASLGVHSMFGSGYHTRIRVSPNGDYAYTVGSDNFVHVYDLNKMVMVAKVAFPAQATAIVKDVVIARDKTLYAIAHLGSNTAVAVATVGSGGSLTWNTSPGNNLGSVQVLEGVQLVTLAASGDKIYAVGTGQGGGLYAATPGKAFPATPTYNNQFAPFGHLVIDSMEEIAYMTASDSGASESYNLIWAQKLSDQGESVVVQLKYQGVTFTGAAGDDIALAADSQGKFHKLYVVVDPSGTYTTKHLLDYKLPIKTRETAPAVPVGLELDSPISLAFNPSNSYLLVGYTDKNLVRVLDPSSDELHAHLFPTELSPQSIAVGPSLDQSSQSVYVLNVLNNTIGVVPAAMLIPSPATVVSMSKLATYRNDALESFADLLGLILEDLKDCFCDRFLVNCPACDGDEKLYLGDIQIRASEVYRICNLDRRRYVKSFPTYGYWLSIVPILPIVKWLIERFCCAVLPDYFRNYQAGEKAGSIDRLSSDQMISAKNFAQNINLSSFAGAQMARLSTSRKLATDAMSAAVFNYQPAAAAQIDQNDLVGQQTEVANQRLAAANIVVDSVQPYNPTAVTTNITTFLGAPTTVPSGSHVVLYEQNGVVRYYALTPTPAPAVQNLTTQIQAQQTALSSLQQSQQVIANQLGTITNYEQEIAALKTSLSAMQQAQTARDQDLADLKSQVQSLVKQPPQA